MCPEHKAPAAAHAFSLPQSFGRLQHVSWTKVGGQHQADSFLTAMIGIPLYTPQIAAVALLSDLCIVISDLFSGLKQSREGNFALLNHQAEMTNAGGEIP